MVGVGGCSSHIDWVGVVVGGVKTSFSTSLDQISAVKTTTLVLNEKKPKNSSSFVVPDKHKDVLKDDRLYPTGWHHREFEGHYRPPLTPKERAAKEAKRQARRQNDTRLESLLRHLAGPSQQMQ